MPDSGPSAAGRPVPKTAELCEILVACLKALAEAGEPEAACKLAGRACAALRKEDRAQWSRFNALLHRLSPMTGSHPG
ncbi:MAG: hypothetical protein L0I29_09405 [Hyphomicrobiales bacterium]|nr:hypothetical protein [Hyphomicrobiales bacterium]